MYHKVTPYFPMKQVLTTPKNKKPLRGSKLGY